MTALTEEKIGELLRLHELAYPAPWGVGRRLVQAGYQVSEIYQPSGDGFLTTWVDQPDPEETTDLRAEASAGLAVHLRNALPDLLEAASASLSHKARADGLEERVAKQQAHIERLRVALHESGKEQVHIDGFRAALEVVESLYVHCDWGPEAKPDDGLRFGLDSARKSLRRSLERLEESARALVEVSPK